MKGITGPGESAVGRKTIEIQKLIPGSLSKKVKNKTLNVANLKRGE